jgi:hypothetical protein
MNAVGTLFGSCVGSEKYDWLTPLLLTRSIARPIHLNLRMLRVVSVVCPSV